MLEVLKRLKVEVKNEKIEIVEEKDEPQRTSTDAEDSDGEEEVMTRAMMLKKRKRKQVILDEDMEKELGVWLQENPFLYNRGLHDFKNTARKLAVLKEKGQSLTPPLSVVELQRWISSMRTRYGRLTKLKSGQAAPTVHTERDKWILQIFNFMGKHIVRHKKPKTLGLKQVCTIFLQGNESNGKADMLFSPLSPGHTGAEYVCRWTAEQIVEKRVVLLNKAVWALGRALVLVLYLTQVPALNTGVQEIGE